MRAWQPWRPPGARRTLVALASIVLVPACGGDDESDGTLAPLEGAPGDTGGTTMTSPAPSAPPTTTVAFEDAGLPAAAGFVSVTVQVASVGIDETLALDRATVPATELDPLNLDASCSALAGGGPLAVSIIDLRRLAAGSRLVSAALRTGDPATEPGEYAGQLEVADAEQLTTIYDGTVLLDDDGRSGSFEGSDAGGNVATGSWVCADQPGAAPVTTN